MRSEMIIDSNFPGGWKKNGSCFWKKDTDMGSFGCSPHHFDDGFCFVAVFDDRVRSHFEENYFNEFVQIKKQPRDRLFLFRSFRRSESFF